MQAEWTESGGWYPLVMDASRTLFRLSHLFFKVDIDLDIELAGEDEVGEGEIGVVKEVMEGIDEM